MPNLAPASRSWLTRPRTVGTPLHWARQGALLGGLLPWSVMASALVMTGLAEGFATVASIFYLSVLGDVAVVSAVAAGTGGAVGMLQPVLLDRVRGRMSLPAVATGQVVLGATLGAAAAAALASMSPVGWWLVSFGGMIGGMAMLLGWLPFTVATVLRLPAWPATVAAAIGTPWAVSLVLRLLGLLGLSLVV
jgi:hypothetical protein